MLKVAVVRGGRSPEREVSLCSGENAAIALKQAGYNIVEMDGDENIVENLRREAVDVVFIALHGQYGEDGTLQGLLEFMDIPYTGSGVMASSLAMNKIKTKEIFRSNDIPTPKWFTITNDLYKTSGKEYMLKVVKEKKIKYPVMIKPADLGSSIGVTKAFNEEDLIKGADKAFLYDSEVLLEEFIPGMELSVPVYGINPPRALPVIEIIPKGEFYTYETKYEDGMSTHIIPARVDEEIYKAAQDLALSAYNSLRCYSFARVDIMVSSEGKLYVLEVNTIPGMTKTSLLPESALKEGITFVEIVDNLVKWSVARHKNEKLYNIK
ncbi:MAG: D-alanine--D-alanine ligase [Armatimonadota bacterium]